MSNSSNIQERLDKMGVLQRIDRVKGSWYVCAVYEPEWGVYGSEDERIVIRQDTKQAGAWWYMPNEGARDVTIDEILALIEETVETNREAVRKSELFKEKIEVLKKIFYNPDIPYASLVNLRFVYDTVPEAPSLDSGIPEVVPSAPVKPAPSKKRQKVEKVVDNSSKESVEATEMSAKDIEELRG